MIFQDDFFFQKEEIKFYVKKPHEVCEVEGVVQNLFQVRATRE